MASTANKDRLSARLIVKTMSLVAAAFAVFHVYTAFYGSFDPLVQRGIFVGVSVGLVFMGWMFNPPKKLSWAHLLNLVLGLVAVYGGLHVAINNLRLMDIMSDLQTFDMILGVVMIALVLEAARRSIGATLPIICLAGLIVYVWGNNFIGGDWRPPSPSYDTVLSQIYGSTKGIFGYMADIGTRVIAIFIVFGALLMSLGAGDAFKQAALVIAGRSNGGPAKVSVVTSALFGTVSGSAVANVVSVGSVTIPTMVRSGYRREFAAGVEATSSAGGQIVPPVMGSGAFIMAEILNVSYYEIALAALIPALLYFLAIFVSVDCFSRSEGLQPLEEDDVPTLRDLLTQSTTLVAFVPLFVLAYMLYDDYTPTLAGAYATAALLAMSFVTRMIPAVMGRDDRGVGAELKLFFKHVFEGLVNGGRGLIVIAALVACASIFLVSLTSTGLGVKLSQMMLGLSGEQMIYLLLMTAVLCILLGMDVPTTASYLLAASVAGPLLSKVGLPPITAHLFIFYFAILSAITPPVCASVYAAASLVNESFWKVAGMALRVAGGAYFIPFLFVFRPALVGDGTTVEVFYNTAIAAIAISGISIALIGYLFRPMPWWSRAYLFCASLVLFYPNLMADLLGLALVATLFLWFGLAARSRARARCNEAG